MPGGIDVGVEVLLGGLARADAVARVVVGKDVAVDSSAEADVETAHLAKVNCVAVGEEHCESERDDTVPLVLSSNTRLYSAFKQPFSNFI